MLKQNRAHQRALRTIQKHIKVKADNMEEELILEFKNTQLLEMKAHLLLDILEAVQSSDAVEKFDVENSIVSKLSKIVQQVNIKGE